jgi:hypothetical protein
MATVFSAIASLQNFFVRDSFEWAIGGLMSIGLLVFLLIPIFKQYLVETKSTES